MVLPPLSAVTVPAVPPKVTLTFSLKLPKFVPVMVTLCPPLVGPESGEMLVTVGAPMLANVYAPLSVSEPPRVVTATSTAPAACPGVLTVNDVGVLEMRPASAPPNVTEMVPEVPKPLPLMTTVWPPAIGPSLGTMLLMLGAP